MRNQGDFVNYLKTFLKGVVKDDTITYFNENKGILDEIEMKMKEYVGVVDLSLDGVCLIIILIGFF